MKILLVIIDSNLFSCWTSKSCYLFIKITASEIFIKKESRFNTYLEILFLIEKNYGKISDKFLLLITFRTKLFTLFTCIPSWITFWWIEQESAYWSGFQTFWICFKIWPTGTSKLNSVITYKWKVRIILHFWLKRVWAGFLDFNQVFMPISLSDVQKSMEFFRVNKERTVQERD